MNIIQVFSTNGRPEGTPVSGIKRRSVFIAIRALGVLISLIILTGSSAQAQCPNTLPLSASGTGVMLESTETDVLYRLLKDGSSMGLNQTGNGGILYWTGLCSGVYTVQGTSMSSSCTVTMNGTVTLSTGSLGTPTGPSPGNFTRCEGGGTTQFSSSLPANAQYLSWTINPEAGSIDNSGLVTWNAGFVGTATITVYAYGCNTSTSSSATVTVTGALGQPSAIGGAGDRCAGMGTANFTSSAANADSYVWQVYPTEAGSFVDPVNMPGRFEWNPSFGGAATVTVIAYGCGGSTTTSATVSTVPAAGMPSNVTADGGITTRCMGGGTTMYSATAGTNASSYIWSITPGAGTIIGSSTSAQVTWNSGFSGQATISVAAVGCNGSATAPASVGMYITPMPAKPSTPESVSGYHRCQGGGQTSFTTSSTNADTYTWTLTPGAGSINSNGLVTWDPNFYGSALITVSASNCSGTSPVSDARTVYVEQSAPLSAISGTFSRCRGGGTTSYTSSAPNATGYNWSVSPAGAGQFQNPGVGTLTWDPAFSGTAIITVTATACTGTLSQTATVEVTPFANVPSAPAPAGGITSRCQGGGTTGYSISTVPNASSYIWSVTPGAGTISGSGLSITVIWNSSYSGSAIVSVAAVSCDGNPTIPATTTMSIMGVPGKPSAPASQSGYSRCQGAGQQAFTTSSPNADSYNWSITPAAGSVSSSGVVTWNENFSGSAVITVSANNCAGTSLISDATTVTVSATGPLSAISGIFSRCSGGGTTSYSSTAPNATGYNWSVSPAGAGQFENPGTGTLSWNPSFSGTAIITVTATGCTGMLSQTATVEVTPLANVPSVPIPSDGLISRCQGAGTSTYTTSGSAATYNWFVSPSGAGTVSGTGTTGTISWNSAFNGIATISVSANGCGGASQPSSISITVNAPVGTPSVPATASTTICQGTTSTTFSSSAANSTGNLLWSASPSQAVTSWNQSTGQAEWEPSFTGQVIITATASGCGGSSASNSLTVTITQTLTPAVSISSNAGSTITLGTPVTFTASPTNGGDSPAYQWKVDGANAGINSATFTTSTLQNGQVVTCTLISNAGCVTTTVANSAAITMTVTGPLSQNYNYIRETVVRVPGMNTNGMVAALSMSNKLVNTTYFDGLGRPMQQVQHQTSPSGKDIVQPIEYDQFGREVRKYLPYADPGADFGSYRTTAVTAQTTFYNTAEAGRIQISPVNSVTPSFAETVFEPSPLNRTLEQGAPGQSWQAGGGHTVRMDYLFNNSIAFGQSGTNLTDSRQVALYSVNVASDGARTLVRTNNTETYADNQLTVTVVKDENWSSGRAGTSEEYKDKNGQVVLKRTYNLNGSTVHQLSTYYVYDDFGNLAFVLPPGANPDATAAISQAALDNFCYQYRYDNRNRMVEKRVPGKGAEYMVYNTNDRVVATQDANQRAKTTPEWTFMKYDALGRNIGSGIYVHSTPGIIRPDLQTLVDATTILWETPPSAAVALADAGYSDTAFPAGGTKTWQTVNYYDTYTHLPLTNLTFDNSFFPDQNQSGQIRSLPTASKVRVLDTGNWLLSANYYNDKGELIQTQAANNVGGKDVYGSKYAFDGVLTDKQRRHHKASMTTADLTIAEHFTYDAAGRMLKHSHKTNSATEVSLAAYAYNEIGQLKEKQLHENLAGGGTTPNITLTSANSVASGQTVTVTAGVSITMQPGFTAASGSTFTAKIQDLATKAQVIQYAYNERGWLKSINDPTVVTDDKVFGMKLYYDDHATTGLKQYNGNISRADWKVKVPAILTQLPTQSYDYEYDKLNRLNRANYIASGNNDKYNEELTYDMMGNIMSLKRKNNVSGYWHNYAYNYTSGGQAGNRLLGISDGATSTAISAYDYDANGNMKSDSQKAIAIAYNQLNLPATVTKAGSTLTYTYDASGRKLKKTIGSDVRDYVDGIEYNGGTIEFVHTAEGRIRPSGGVYTYDYMLKDHLGNVRALVNQDGSVADISDYYAFGLEIGDPINPSPDNKYKYNGKEWNTDLSLNSYDYGARFYDPVIGRWNTVDPLAELGRRWSPYAYGFNNPERFTDPDGMWPWDGIVERATNYVANKAKDAAFQVAKNIVTSVREGIKDIKNQYEVGFYAEGNVKAKGAVGGAMQTKISGGKVIHTAKEIGSLQAGAEYGTNGFKNTSEGKYAGKDGNNTMTKGLGASSGAGFDYEQETVVNNGRTISDKKSLTVNYGIADLTKSSEGDTKTTRLGVGASYNMGLFLIFSAEIKGGIQLKEKEQ